MSTGNKVAELRTLANLTAEAALSTAPGQQVTVLEAAEQLGRFADGLERRAKSALTEPAVVELPSNATSEEVHHARRRQAARRGTEVYLPSWSVMARALPNAFLRTALFSAGRAVQADNAMVLSSDPSLLVAGKEIASFRKMTVIFSGYQRFTFLRALFESENFRGALHEITRRPHTAWETTNEMVRAGAGNRYWYCERHIRTTAFYQ